MPPSDSTPAHCRGLAASRTLANDLQDVWLRKWGPCAERGSAAAEQSGVGATGTQTIAAMLGDSPGPATRLLDAFQEVGCDNARSKTRRIRIVGEQLRIASGAAC